jgi:hypothetical protein
MCTVGAQFSLYSLQYSRWVISLHSTTTQKVSPSFLKKKCITLAQQKLICRDVIYERFMVNPQNDKKINQNTTPSCLLTQSYWPLSGLGFGQFIFFIITVHVSSISVCRTEKQSFYNCLYSTVNQSFYNCTCISYMQYMMLIQYSKSFCKHGSTFCILFEQKLRRGS